MSWDANSNNGWCLSSESDAEQGAYCFEELDFEANGKVHCSLFWQNISCDNHVIVIKNFERSLCTLVSEFEIR